MTYTDIQALINANLASGINIPAVDHRAVEHALLDYIKANLSQSGDIKRVKCDLTYLTANFEVDGLGKNLRLGWAICNGNYGTDNLAGKSGIGYGLGFSTLGQELGYADTTLVEHSHFSVSTAAVEGVFSSIRKFLGSLRTSGVNLEYDLQGKSTIPTTGETTTVGLSGTGKNYHPSVINLYIMKL